VVCDSESGWDIRSFQDFVALSILTGKTRFQVDHTYVFFLAAVRTAKDYQVEAHKRERGLLPIESGFDKRKTTDLTLAMIRASKPQRQQEFGENAKNARTSGENFQMGRFIKRLEGTLVVLVFMAGAAFLLKMCYLSLLFNTIFALIFLIIFYSYIRVRHEIRLPLRLLLFVFAALQIDALGNYFRMYGRQFGPMQYDEFSHLTVQILVTPLIVWLVSKAWEKRGYDLPAGLTCFFAGTTIFSLSAFYEIIELWDEVYFHGQRIWSMHDTATDLQWDLVGILIGCLLASAAVRARRIVPQPAYARLTRHLNILR